MMIDLENWLLKLRECNGILSCSVKQEVAMESLKYTKAISGTFVLEVAVKPFQLEWPYCCMNVMQKMLQCKSDFRQGHVCGFHGWRQEIAINCSLCTSCWDIVLMILTLSSNKCM